MSKKAKRDKETIGVEEALEALGRVFSWFEKKAGPGSEFMDHMRRSKIEFLRGIKTLVDSKIEEMEKKQSPKGRKRATKVNVE
jgi:hypothetical protein